LKICEKFGAFQQSFCTQLATNCNQVHSHLQESEFVSWYQCIPCLVANTSPEH